MNTEDQPTPATPAKAPDFKPVNPIQPIEPSNVTERIELAKLAGQSGPQIATPHPLADRPLSEASAKRIRFHELTTEDKDQIADLRCIGDVLGETIEKLLAKGADPRWVGIARTHWQQGLMAAVRSVAKPDFF